MRGEAGRSPSALCATPRRYAPPKSTKPKKTKPPKMTKSILTKSILKKPKPKRGRIRWRFPIASTRPTVVEPMEKVNLAETFTELPEVIDPKWPAAIAFKDELYGDL